MCHLPVCHAGILIKLGVSGAGRMPTKSATGDPRCSRLEPKRREVPANAPVGSPAIVFYGQTGLQPLCIRKAGIGDAAERRP